MLATEAPFPQYYDLDGRPLNGGSLYFGQANQNPETNPITVYWDVGGTQPAAQPIRTINGFPSRSGTAAAVYVPGDYSLTVRDRRGRLIANPANSANAGNSASLLATINNFIASTASSAGASLIGFIQAGVGAIVSTLQAKGRQIVNAKDYGALSTNTTGQNKTAVQAGITYLNLVGGGRLEIDADCNYGYKVRDLTTHPSFAGVTADIVVVDRSAGSSYVAPAKDGAQIREFFSTAQTSNALNFTAGLGSTAVSGTLASNWSGATGPWLVTFSNGDKRVVSLTNGLTTATWTTGLSSSATSAATYLNPGNHDGNTKWHRSTWGPFLIISNDAALPAVGDPNRTVTDNRRAHMGFALDGNIAFYLGIGTQSGYQYSDGQMANFHLNRAMVSATPWVTGTHYIPDQNVTQGGVQYVCLVDHVAGTFTADLLAGDWTPTAQETTAYLIDYQTGRMSWNHDSNGFLAGYHFVERTPGVVQMMVESKGTKTYFVLRNVNGAAQDVDIRNNSGDLELLIDASGTGFTVRSGTRRCVAGLSFVQQRFSQTYAASMAIDTTRGNIALIVPTDGAAFTMAPPTGTSAVSGESQLLTITIRNTTGGALGAVTWNTIFRLSAWTQPANGFSRSITFMFDGVSWVETARTPADVPN